jgi:hypothetical protein
LLLILLFYDRVNIMEGFRAAVGVCEEAFEAIAINLDTLQPPLVMTPSNYQSPATLPADIIESISSGNYTTNKPKQTIQASTELGDTDWFFEGEDNTQQSSTQHLRDNIKTSNSSKPEDLNDTSWFFDGEENAEEEVLQHNLALLTSTLSISSSPTIPSTNEDVAWFFEEESGNGQEQISTKSHIVHESTTSQSAAATASTNILDIIGRGLAHGREDMMAIAVQVARILVCCCCSFHIYQAFDSSKL